jgi:hypothetical protein
MNANWYPYVITPIDFGWEYLRTIEETAVFMAKQEAYMTREHPSSHVVYKTVDFLLSWENAKRLALQLGWGGDFSEECRVTWVESEDSMKYGFVFKEVNNGTTYVISPIPRPDLQPLMDVIT